MNSDDHIHKPELPGVRTMGKDVTNKSPADVSGVTLTVPEKVSTENQGEMHKGGHLHNGKELFDVERAFNNEEVQQGTIVTDHKHKRMSVGTLLKSAFTEWWGTTQKSVEGSINKLEFLQPKEEPTVATPETRVTTIQEAAKLARQAPKDDHEMVIEKVRTFAHDAETITGKPFTIKEPVKESAHWNDTKEEKKEPITKDEKSTPPIDLRNVMIAPHVEKRITTPLTNYTPTNTPKPNHSIDARAVEKAHVSPLRTPEKRPVNVPSVQKNESSWSHFTTPKTSSVDLRSQIKDEEKREPPVILPRRESPQNEARPRFTTPPELSNKPETRDEKAIHVTPTIFENREEEKTAVYTSPLEEEKQIIIKPQKLKSPSFLPRVFVTTFIILIGVLLGVTAAIVSIKPNPKNEEVIIHTVHTPRSYLRTDAEIPVPLGESREEFYKTLIEKREEVSPVSHQYPTVGMGDTTAIAKKEDIMRVLNWNAPGSFLRSIGETIMFGSINGSTSLPFIILESTNFDTAFAGMLSWEKHMSADLSPLFGEPTHTTNFTDALTTNRSIRIQRDLSGSEKIVYAFVNKNLIVITTSVKGLSTLIERIKNDTP